MSSYGSRLGKGQRRVLLLVIYAPQCNLPKDSESRNDCPFPLPHLMSVCGRAGGQWLENESREVKLAAPEG